MKILGDSYKNLMHNRFNLQVLGVRHEPNDAKTGGR